MSLSLHYSSKNFTLFISFFLVYFSKYVFQSLWSNLWILSSQNPNNILSMALTDFTKRFFSFPFNSIPQQPVKFLFFLSFIDLNRKLDSSWRVTRFCIDKRLSDTDSDQRLHSSDVSKDGQEGTFQMGIERVLWSAALYFGTVVTLGDSALLVLKLYLRVC